MNHSLPALQNTWQGVCGCWEGRTLLHATCRVWFHEGGDAVTSPHSPLCRPLHPANAPCPPRGTVSRGARRGWGAAAPGRAGLPHPGSSERLSGRVRVLRGDPGRGPPSSPARGLLTSRHAGAHRGAAGPQRCASGASGSRALMSPRAWARARRRRSWRAGGRAARRGPGLRSPRLRLRRVVPAAASRAARALRAAGSTAGGGPGDRPPRARSAQPRGGAPPLPPPGSPVAAARAGGCGGRRRLAGCGKSGWPRRARGAEPLALLSRHLVTGPEGQGRGWWGRRDSGIWGTKYTTLI